MRLLHSGRFWLLPAGISTAAALVAFLFSLIVFPRIQTSLNANIDPDRLGELSRNIFDGKGYVYTNGDRLEPAFDRGPVYPGVVATLHFITGSTSFVPVQIFQSVLHGLTCWIVFQLAALIYPRRLSLTTQILCALHPMLVWYTARVWIETTHTFLVTLSAYLLLRLMNDPSLLKSCATGFLLGVTSLTKSILFPFSILIGLYVAGQGRPGSRIAGLALTTVCILVVIPWTMRNYSASGMLVPVHTSLGLNLMQGDAIAEHWCETPLSTLAIWEKGNARKDSILGGSNISAIDPPGDQLLTRTAMKYYLSHPLFAAQRFFLNSLTFCYLSESPLKSTILAIVQFPLYALAFASVIRAWRKRAEIRMLALLVGYYILAHALIVGWVRYSVPIVPILVVLAVGVAQFPGNFHHPSILFQRAFDKIELLRHKRRGNNPLSN
jgi:4-amino-4-deoxy-L-arabinose transferase-like glycosyltransferase